MQHRIYLCATLRCWVPGFVRSCVEKNVDIEEFFRSLRYGTDDHSCNFTNGVATNVTAFYSLCIAMNNDAVHCCCCHQTDASPKSVVTGQADYADIIYKYAERIIRKPTCFDVCNMYDTRVHSPVQPMYGKVTCRRAVTASWSWKSATAMWLDVSTLMNINISDKKSTTMRVTDATVTVGADGWRRRKVGQIAASETTASSKFT